MRNAVCSSPSAAVVSGPRYPAFLARRRPGVAWALTIGLVLAMVATALAVEPSGPRVPQALLDRALLDGSVRVIVRLQVTLTPESAPEPAIKAAQDAVLRELASTPHAVRRRYATVPLLALEVSADALRTLAASQLVLAVVEDALSSPH